MFSIAAGLLIYFHVCFCGVSFNSVYYVGLGKNIARAVSHFLIVKNIFNFEERMQGPENH
jgi:hypothetical protein